MNKLIKYKIAKQQLQNLNLSAKEYEEKIKLLAQKLGI